MQTVMVEELDRTTIPSSTTFVFVGIFWTAAINNYAW